MKILIDAEMEMKCKHIDCALGTMATALILLQEWVQQNNIKRTARIVEYENEGGYIKIETID